MQMSKTVSIDNKISSKHAHSKWDIAIEDTEKEIRDLTRQRARLAYALRVFRMNKRDGIPWPGKKQYSKLS